MPRNATGSPSTRPSSTAGRLQPGLGDPHQGPGPRHAAALARTNPVGARPSSARYARQATRRSLVLDARTGERWPIWVELDTNADARARPPARDPPGAQPPEGHRYVVVLRGLRTAAGRRSGPAALRRAARRRRGGRRATTASSGPARRPGSARTRRSSWPGTSRWPAAARCPGACSRMRDDAFAQLGDRNLADGVVQGARAGASRSTRLARRRRREVRRPLRAGARGHDHGPVLPRPARLRARRRASTSAPDGLPAQLPGNVLTAHFICVVPAHGDRRRAGAAVPLRPRPARQRPTRSSTSPTCRRWPTSTTSCSARRRGSGMSDEDIPQRRQRAAGLSAGCRRSPTACSRACSNALLPRPADGPPAGPGDASPLLQQDGRPIVRHRPTLLRRQQPGRDHGRRADRASRPTSPAPCSASRA